MKMYSTVNDEPVAHIKVENRGRVYRFVVKIPIGQFTMSTHELIAGIPSPGAHNGDI
jgi:hypothetical protein